MKNNIKEEEKRSKNWFSFIFKNRSQKTNIILFPSSYSLVLVVQHQQQIPHIHQHEQNSTTTKPITIQNPLSLLSSIFGHNTKIKFNSITTYIGERRRSANFKRKIVDLRIRFISSSSVLPFLTQSNTSSDSSVFRSKIHLWTQTLKQVVVDRFKRGLGRGKHTEFNYGDWVWFMGVKEFMMGWMGKGWMEFCGRWGCKVMKGMSESY